MAHILKYVGTCLLGFTLMSTAHASDYKVIVADQPPPATGGHSLSALADGVTGSTETKKTEKSSTDIKKITAAEKRAYTLTYTGKNKGPELSNVKVKGQLFQNNRPVSFFEAKTNEDGKFAFNKDYGRNVSISLHHISSQDKLKVRCEGLARPGTKEVKVTCRKR